MMQFPIKIKICARILCNPAFRYINRVLFTKLRDMKVLIISTLTLLLGMGTVYQGNQIKTNNELKERCVYRNLMGEEEVSTEPVINDSREINLSMERGLLWLEKAQQANGAWGAGLHSKQNVIDPHAVATDPATTAMVGMALLRTGNTMKKGDYAQKIKELSEYILQFVEGNENASMQGRGTQIQAKLGSNIDVILSSQYLSNLLESMEEDNPSYNRVTKAIDISVKKIQDLQDQEGRVQGAGWAGVLQTSLAANALEVAEAGGAKVDKAKLDKYNAYQKSNYNVEAETVDAIDGAGVMLYAVSGSARASSKEAKKAEKAVKDALALGVIESDDVSIKNLEETGMSKDQAIKLETAYRVYNSAKNKSQQDAVMNGFGNNGGEEFISFLQTGESMIINQDESWENWYQNISKKMLEIQENNGSWRGHHCITSPVFCTATCILILSIQNDIAQLEKIGE